MKEHGKKQTRNKNNPRNKTKTDKPHKCKIEGCKRTYTLEHYLQNHLVSRHGIQKVAKT